MLHQSVKLDIEKYLFDSKIADIKDRIEYPILTSNKNSETFICKINDKSRFVLKFIKKEIRKSIKLYESSTSLSYDSVTIPNEFENLKYLEKKGLVEMHMVPKPYTFLKDKRCILMEYIEGKRFQDQITPFSVIKNRLNNRLDTYFALTSDYLVDFEKSVYEGKSKPVEPFVERMIEKELKLISFLSSNQKKVVSKTLRDIGTSFTKIPVHFVSTDFKPHNIIINKSIVGIDWGMVKYNGFTNWMPASFVRILRGANRLQFLERPLQEFFIENYANKSLFGLEFFNLAQIFDTIISSTKKENNFKFFRKRFEHLTKVDI